MSEAPKHSNSSNDKLTMALYVFYFSSLKVECFQVRKIGENNDGNKNHP